MKSILAIAILAVSMVQHLWAQSGWYSPASTTDDLHTVFFIDSLNGWIGGNSSTSRSGIIKRTENGGTTWVPQTLPVSSAILRILFLDLDVGFAVGDEGIILKSVDGGEHWVQKPSGTGRPLTSVHFIDGNKGWACGRDTLVSTTDQGETWRPQNVPAISHWDIAFRTPQEGWVVGVYGSSSKSTDGGEHWSAINPPVAGRSLFGVCFPSPSRGIVIGGDQIALSVNGGASWASVYSSGFDQLNSVSFSDVSTGLVVGSYKIVKTTNGGSRWYEQAWPEPKRYLMAVHCPDPQHAWAVGDRLILKTRDGGGVTGVPEHSEGEPCELALHQNFPNPFNPRTRIEFSLMTRGHVRLAVHDILGSRVAMLVDEKRNAGTHVVTFDGTGLASGIYIYRLTTGSTEISRKALMLK